MVGIIISNGMDSSCLHCQSLPLLTIVLLAAMTAIV